MMLQEIQSKCSAELIASRDHDAIAAAVNVGRIRIAPKLGGFGLVLETLGPEAGAALLDALEAQKASISALKWAWYLLERGELDFGSDATRGMIYTLVPSPAKEALLAVAQVPDPVTAQQVSDALRAK